MIDAGYCRLMARYNVWQNKQLTDIMQGMTPKELTQDRKAFFGSILGTVNHLLWGDQLWISRFDGGDGPEMSNELARGGLHPTFGAWSADRFRTDGRIKLWADTVKAIDLKDSLTWYSAGEGREFTKPLETLVVHFFNHQTHHRGQVHAMLTAAGHKAPTTDIPYMPED